MFDRSTPRLDLFQQDKKLGDLDPLELNGKIQVNVTVLLIAPVR